MNRNLSHNGETEIIKGDGMLKWLSIAINFTFVIVYIFFMVNMKSIYPNREDYFAMFWLFLGLIAANYFGLVYIYEQVIVSKWPKVKCKILETNFYGISTADKIKFEYEFNNTKYISGCFTKSSMFISDHTKRKAIFDQYKANREYDCFVNPRKPKEAVMVYYVDCFGSLLLSFFSFLFLICFLIMLK